MKQSRLLYSCLYIILSTDQEIIPARNAVDALAQDFVANEELLLPILKEFPQCRR
jgi:hypothetical protein